MSSTAATARAVSADLSGRLTLAGVFAKIVGPRRPDCGRHDRRGRGGDAAAGRGVVRFRPAVGGAGHRADGGHHARLGVAGRDPVGRPRHGRHGAERVRRLAGLGHRRADGAGQRRRQHEPDVGDGRGHLWRPRHAAASHHRRRAGRRRDRAHPDDRRRRGARRLQARREDHDGAAAGHPRLLHHRGDQGPARLAHLGGTGPGPGSDRCRRRCRSSAATGCATGSRR